MSHAGILINGQWQIGNGLALNSENPMTGTSLWQANSADADQVQQAVDAARNALSAWSRKTLAARIEILEAFRSQLEQNKAELAECIAQETGKPRWESLTEVGAMIGKLAISITAQAERTGSRESEAPGATALLQHKPHGVVAVFGPYNFPGHLPNGHITPALLAGNTIVFKPSELTPKVAELTVKYWLAAGLPEGVINLVQGARDTGKALAENTGIDGLFFTGSPATGQIIHKQFSGNPGKILALELGGNNPLVIQNISNVPAAVYQTIQSAFISAGQRCTCARRLILVEGDDTKQFITALVAATKKIVCGAYDDDPQPYMGTVISNQAADAVLQAQKKLQQAGAESLLSSERLVENRPLLSPGIIDVTNVKSRSDQEIFGPLLQVIWVKDFTSAMTEANNTQFGLAAGLFSDDVKLFDEFYYQSRAGIVNFNRQLTGASSAAPFGGIGASGNHRASAYYAADYCAYPVASLSGDQLELPANLSPGVEL